MGRAELPNQIQKKKQGFFRRSSAWLFSQRHFHFKVLSGTAVGVTVIVLLAGIFLYVTLRNHYQDVMRAHTIQVIRLSNSIENDIAALESDHRGFLLTGQRLYGTSSDQQIKSRIEELTSVILDSPQQRKRIMKVQEVVQKWMQTVATPQIEAKQKADGRTAVEEILAHGGPAPLGNSLLDQAREILQSIQDEEQIVLNKR